MNRCSSFDFANIGIHPLEQCRGDANVVDEKLVLRLYGHNLIFLDNTSERIMLPLLQRSQRDLT